MGLTVLDSSVWVALFAEDDSQHQKAKDVFRRLNGHILIPEYVLVEVMNALARKASKELADTFLKGLFTSEAFFLQNIQSAELEILMHFYLNSEHEGLSFVDHHLLLLSKQHQVVTFDQKLEEVIGA